MSPLSDHLIHWREALSDWITFTNHRQMLNSGQAPVQTGGAIAAQLKKALDEIKAGAIMDNGAFVDYHQLRHSQAYRRYQQELSPGLAAFDPASLASRQEKIAFWVNLYNALVLDGVIQLGITKSVTEGHLGILAFFRRASYLVNGRRVSCNDIEHGILRANHGFPYLPGPHFTASDRRKDWVITPLEPRIHFALNCASRSCPPLQFYTSKKLDIQLDLAARNFIDQTTKVSPDDNTIRLSAIFNWYKRDFGGKKGVLEFTRRYLPDDERREWLARQGEKILIRYSPYDWGINQYKSTV